MVGPSGSDSTDFVNSSANENRDKAGTLRELTGRETELKRRTGRDALPARKPRSPGPILFCLNSWRNANATVLPIICIVPGKFRKQLPVLTVRATKLARHEKNLFSSLTSLTNLKV